MEKGPLSGCTGRDTYLRMRFFQRSGGSGNFTAAGFPLPSPFPPVLLFSSPPVPYSNISKDAIQLVTADLCSAEIILTTDEEWEKTKNQPFELSVN